MNATKQAIWVAAISALAVILAAFIGILPSLYNNANSKEENNSKDNLSVVNIKAPFQLDSHFYPSGWMGDGKYGTKYLRITNSLEMVNEKTEAIVTLSYKSGPKGWAGVYWQYPDSNWGEKPGKNINGSKEIVFLARGKEGGEVVKFKSGGIRGEYFDKHEVSLDKIVLSKNWRQFRMDIANEDLSNVIGAFACVIIPTPNKNGIVIQLAKIIVR